MLKHNTKYKYKVTRENTKKKKCITTREQLKTWK